MLRSCNLIRLTVRYACGILKARLNSQSSTTVTCAAHQLISVRSHTSPQVRETSKKWAHFVSVSFLRLSYVLNSLADPVLTRGFHEGETHPCIHPQSTIAT